MTKMMVMTAKKGRGTDILRMFSSKIYRISENEEIIKLSFKTPIKYFGESEKI